MNSPRLVRNLGLSLLALVVVLLATWWLVPKALAPFIYQYF